MRCGFGPGALGMPVVMTHAGSPVGYHFYGMYSLRQGIIGNWWWQYRVPGWGQLNWSTLIVVLVESDHDYVLCIENEDRRAPGLERFAIGCRQFPPLLARKETI